MDPPPQPLLGRFRAFFGQIIVKSAANPSLWLCIVTILCFILAYLTSDTGLRWGLFAIGVLPVVNALVTIQRFLWKDPGNLRSEAYHLRAQLMERMGDESNQLDVAQILLNPPRTIPPPSSPDEKSDE